MSALLVRGATGEDAEAAVAVLQASITRSCVEDHRNDPKILQRWLANETPGQFRCWLADPGTFILVAFEGSVLAGVGAFRTIGSLDLCYVHPDRQRSGIGRSILQALESEARARGITRLELTSTAIARGFYEAHGYALVGTESQPGSPEVDYRYAKHLH